VDPRRLSAGEWVAAVSGVLLVISLFLPWYTSGGRSATAWQAMTVDDVLMAVAGVGAVVAVLATATRAGIAVPVAYIVLAAIVGMVAAIVAIWRVVDPAPAGEVGLGVGAWIGLAAALGVAGGSLAGARDEGPARRSANAEKAAAEAARGRAELLSIPAGPGMQL
jgi:hypothetical protein